MMNEEEKESTENLENAAEPSSMDEVENVNPDDLKNVSTFRKLVVEPEKRDMDNQIVGMKDLFTSILAENKREYNAQVSDMKDLFIGILEENRKAFQMQLQDLYDKIPTMISSSVQNNQQEEHLYLTKYDEYSDESQVERLSRINAVKEIILGNNIDEINDKLQLLSTKLTDIETENQQKIVNMTEETTNRLKQMEENISQRLNDLAREIGETLQTQDGKFTKAEDAYQVMATLSQQVAPPKR